MKNFTDELRRKLQRELLEICIANRLSRIYQDVVLRLTLLQYHHKNYQHLDIIIKNNSMTR
jgi:hypothetical protein